VESSAVRRWYPIREINRRSVPLQEGAYRFHSILSKDTFTLLAPEDLVVGGLKMFSIRHCREDNLASLPQDFGRRQSSRCHSFAEYLTCQNDSAWWILRFTLSFLGALCGCRNSFNLQFSMMSSIGDVVSLERSRSGMGWAPRRVREDRHGIMLSKKRRVTMVTCEWSLGRITSSYNGRRILGVPRRTPLAFLFVPHTLRRSSPCGAHRKRVCTMANEPVGFGLVS
jgi:hypothetical protein